MNVCLKFAWHDWHRVFCLVDESLNEQKVKLIVASSVPISAVEQIGQRSSSVDFTDFPGQRRDLQAATAALNLKSGSSEGSPTPRRAGSVKRNDSIKRTDSMKKKKARPMIWDHFDDMPHTR